MTRITTILATVLSFMAFTPLAAQDFQKGYDAYQAGDYATALQEWTPLAEAGDASAQYNLGLMYDNGQGVLQDEAEAEKWMRLAAEQGLVPAQYNLGFIYHNGKGVLPDYTEAVKWYRLAADQGNADAQYNLGVMYANGWGVPLDDTEAGSWYRLAAEQGLSVAQGNLGFMYDNGIGVLQDNVMAHMWYNIGATNDNDLIIRSWRDNLAKEMTAEDISKAQAMARECMSSGYQKCGLDLRGSVQLLAKVKIEQVYEARMHSLWPEVRDTLAAQRDVVGFVRRASSVADELRVRISQPDGMNHALELVSGLARIRRDGQTDIAVGAVTDTEIIIILTDPEKLAIEDQTMRQTLEVVRRRIDEMGVRGLSIQRRGGANVLIQLPSISSAQEVKYIIGTTAQLGFHPVVSRTSDPDARAGAGNIIIPSIYEPETYYVLEGRSVVSGEDVLDARVGLDKNDRPTLNFRLNMTGSRKFSEYTADNIGFPFAIVLDSEVISAPTIKSHIAGGSGIITGRFSVKDVTNLAILLRAGTLPAELEFSN